MEEPLEKIGVLLDNLGPSQLNFLAIKNAAKNKKDDVILFFSNLEQPIIKPYNACMLINEIYGHECIAIATDVNTAEILLNVFGPKDKYFYVWDLEFVSYCGGQGVKHFDRYQQIYTNPKLKLIARTEEYAKLIEKTFGRKVEYLMHDMDFVLYRRD